MIKVVTFDLDNTLWETNNVIRRAEANMRTWLSSRVPEFEARFDNEAIGALRKELVQRTPDLAHDLSRLRTQVLLQAIKRCGYADGEARAHAEGAFEVFLRGRHEVDYYDGALEMLDTLAGRYVLGALTNGNADFTRLGLQRFFSFGFSSADVGASKPHPAMFQAALAHTGVDATAAVHVGDHPVDDIQGAREIGMHTVWVNHLGIEGDVDATAEVGRLIELPAAIEGLA